jgi:hypothetical protein
LLFANTEAISGVFSIGLGLFGSAPRSEEQLDCLMKSALAGNIERRPSPSVGPRRVGAVTKKKLRHFHAADCQRARQSQGSHPSEIERVHQLGIFGEQRVDACDVFATKTLVECIRQFQSEIAVGASIRLLGFLETLAGQLRVQDAPVMSGKAVFELDRCGVARRVPDLWFGQVSAETGDAIAGHRNYFGQNAFGAR